MFRTLRARGGVLSLSRLPLRVRSEARQNALSVQRVRFRRPNYRPRAMLSSVLTVAVFYGLFTHIVLSPLDKVAEELEGEIGEEQQESLFFPFPGTTKIVQPGPYRGSDPEWQEYIKFSKNPAAAKKAKDDLAQFILSMCEKSPVIKIRCGQNISVRRYWLDMDFPLKPPPEFERSGIEIADDYVAWTTMPVDSLTVFRIRQALWPSAMTKAFWSFSKALVLQDAAKLAGMVGIQIKPQPSLEAILAAHAAHAKQHRPEVTKPEALSENSNPPPTPSALEGKEQTQAETVKKDIPGQQLPTNHLSKSTDKTEVDPTKAHNNIFAIKMQLFAAYMAFRTKLAQTWKPAPSFPPRGCILVSGLVELDSTNAWVVMDVKAWFDPKTRKYDPRSMAIAVRRLQAKKQAPMVR